MKETTKVEIHSIISSRLKRFRDEVSEAAKCAAYMERQMATLQNQMTKQQEAHEARIKFFEERLNRFNETKKRKWWKK